MLEKCKKQGLSKKILDKIPPYEVSIRAINSELKDIREKREEMLEVFNVPTKRNNRHGSNTQLIGSDQAGTIDKPLSGL